MRRDRMNIALLNEQEIDIEKLSGQLEEDGLERHEIKKKLNDHYRRFSQKGDFRCVSCKERVEMVLTEDKVFHFRHYDKEKCTYSENHKTYKTQRENIEDLPKHRAGKAILQTYLEGTCITKNIRVMDGYRFKNALSFVPDFILEFPNGQTWAIDYLTGLKNDLKYANSLKKRRNTYIQHGFTPIFLFDSYWLAYEPEIYYVSLVEGELLCVKETNQDYKWTNFISGLEANLKNILLNDHSFHLQVKSMVYFSPHEREINIIRFLQDHDNPRKTRTVYNPIKIPLEKALMINQEQSDFIYSDENEDEYRKELKKQLEQVFQQQENLRKQQAQERARKEAEERAQREFARAQEEERKKRAAQSKKDYDDRTSEISFTGRSQKQMDADLKREIAALQRKNKNSFWYKQMIQDMLKSYEGEGDVRQNLQTEVDAPINEERKALASSTNDLTWEAKNNLLKNLPSWKVNELLNHYINGEAYFIGGKRKWKEVLLNVFELIYQNKITIPEVLQKIKAEGIEFSQPEQTMSHPIREYIEYISKKVKNPRA